MFPQGGEGIRVGAEFCLCKCFYSLSLQRLYARTRLHIGCVLSFCLLFCQEFAKAVEPENVKQDIIPLFHTLASDEQVRREGRGMREGGGESCEEI